MHRSTAVTALALASSLALAAGPVVAAPTPTPSSSTSSASVTGVKVLCDAIGEDTVAITGDLSSGGTAKITRGPLSVVGRPGFTGTDASGDTVSVAPTGQGATCTATETTKGDDLDEILPASQAQKEDSSGEVKGRLTFTVSVDASAQPAQRRSDTAAGAKLPFEAELRKYLNSRPGAVGVAVRLPGTGKSWTYTKTSARNVTASIVKVEIMSAVMLKAQDEGRSLTSWEKSKIVPMIRNSDNSATTALFNHIGGRAGLDRASKRLGLSQTTADPYNHWGLTSTTAFDQAKLMEHYVKPSKVFTTQHRVYGVTQMHRINSSQDWGVSAGPPAGSVALKNGWLPRTDGWHVNSIGWQNYGKADYTIGVLTHHNPGAMKTQISTIEGVSKIVWRNRLQLPDKPVPPKKRGVRGDLDGDGKVDLMGASTDGRVYFMKGAGNGTFAAKKVASSGLSDATWFGTAGDVNRDGRSDVLVRRGDGRLQLILATSSGTLGTPKTIITGWGSVTDITAGGDVDGNGKLDVLIRRDGGYVRHYELSDSGRLKRVRDMGKPVQWYPSIQLVSDVNSDGKDDLRGLAPGGRMRTWTSTGTRWKQTSETSLGWNAYRAVAVPGDVNGSSLRQDDIVAVPQAGPGKVFMGTKGGGQTSTYRSTREDLGGLVRVF